MASVGVPSRTTHGRRLDITVDGRSVPVRAWESLPTVARPLVPEYQVLNLKIIIHHTMSFKQAMNQ